ncbi:MAG: hypothetical protein INR65_16375 [Gluconacetobacter diazotrophicus]|nr:hypothetical protein [Gluconacetobacter diazotrophicus]
MSPVPDREPEIAPSGGGNAARATLYGALGLVLLAGAWVRFAPTIDQVAPALAPPVAAGPQQARSDSRPGTLVEAQSVPAAEVGAAIAAMKLPADQSAALADAVKRDRLRLVTLPLFDAGMATPAAGAGGPAVTVSTAGFSRVVPLTRQPVPVVLPIDRVGTVTFQVASAAKAGPVGLGALTVTGPVRLPDMARGDVLSVGVMAQ